MEPYHFMNRNELLRKLQQQDKYSNVSQKNIGTNKTINNLRAELEVLEENELKTIPLLPDDVIKEILYQSDINTIINYCTTNKYNVICNDANFWKMIFQRDNIRILLHPTNAKEWIELYKRTLDAQKEALVIETLPFTLTRGVYKFQITGRFDKHFYKYAGFLPKVNIFYTNMGTGYVNMRTDYVVLRSDGYNNKLISKEKFYNLLVDLLYFYPDINITTLNIVNNSISLRKKDISLLRNTGYNTIATTISYHNQKLDMLFTMYGNLTNGYDYIRHHFKNT